MANRDENNPPEAEQPEVVEWVEQPLLQTAYVTSDGRILKGIDAEAAPFGAQPVRLLCLHSVDIPLPSDDPKVIAQSCVRTVPHPILGSTKQFAVSMDVGLAMLEVAHALQKRDERLDAQDEKIAELKREMADAAQALDEMAKTVQALAVDRGPDAGDQGDVLRGTTEALHRLGEELNSPGKLKPEQVLALVANPELRFDLLALAQFVQGNEKGMEALYGIGLKEDSRLAFLLRSDKYRETLLADLEVLEGLSHTKEQDDG
jgi:hypothetical protein